MTRTKNVKDRIIKFLQSLAFFLFVPIYFLPIFFLSSYLSVVLIKDISLQEKAATSMVMHTDKQECLKEVPF